jgi:hypothetical protein
MFSNCLTLPAGNAVRIHQIHDGTQAGGIVRVVGPEVMNCVFNGLDTLKY